jgi:hypothetical protein
MNADLDYLYAHHAVGLCPEERCVTARANLAALMEAGLDVERLARAIAIADLGADSAFKADGSVYDADRNNAEAVAFEYAALQGRVASREGSGT